MLFYIWFEVCYVNWATFTVKSPRNLEQINLKVTSDKIHNQKTRGKGVGGRGRDRDRQRGRERGRSKREEWVNPDR